jgi:hypothetical protein
MTLANAPLSGWDGKSYRVICPSEKQKYFCSRGWTTPANHGMGGAGDLPDGSALVRDILPVHMNGNPLKPDQLFITGFADRRMRHTRHRQIMDAVSMPGLLTKRLRSIAATSLLAALVVMATVPPVSAAPPRLLADALPPGHPSCHAQAFDAAELAAHPDRRVTAISIERTAPDLAAERKWGALEQFDGTPVVSATLRIRLRGDPVAHSARLACYEGDDGTLICENPAASAARSTSAAGTAARSRSRSAAH